MDVLTKYTVMRWFSLLAIFVPLALISVTGQAPRNLERDKAGMTHTDARTALIIGNGKYTDIPLRNPPNDAMDMAATLKTLGFEVLSYTDLDQNGMKRAIKEFGAKLRAKGGVGLFYYAGHGVQSKGVNYLIPISAKVDTEEEVEYESVEAGLVLAQMESAKNGMNIVILDACRNNPFARSFRSAEKGLASIDAPSGTLLAYSTAPGSVASDGVGRNGLYTQELLRQIKTPGVSIEDVFKQVRISVRGATTEKQTPWEVSSLVGNFYFAGKPNGNSPSTVTTKLEPPFAEKLPSAEGVLSDFAQAVGSAKNITTLILKGTVEGNYKGQKYTGEVETYMKFPGQGLSVMKLVNGTSSKAGYDGSKGWQWGSRTGSKDMTVEQLAIQRHTDAVFFGDINAIRAYYPKMAVKAKGEVDGKEVYLVDLTTPEGKTDRLYFGVDSKVIYRWDSMFSSVASQSGISFPAEFYLGDYIAVNGRLIPMTMRQKDITDMTVRFDILATKFNVPLDDKLFKKP